MDRLKRWILCRMLNWHDWTDFDWALFTRDETRRPLYLKRCVRCAFLYGHTLTDEQRDNIEAKVPPRGH